MYTIYNVLARVLGLFGEYSNSFFSGRFEAFAICMVPLLLYRAPLLCPLWSPALSSVISTLPCALDTHFLPLPVTTPTSGHTAVWLISKAVISGRSHLYWHRNHVGHLTELSVGLPSWQAPVTGAELVGFEFRVALYRGSFLALKHRCSLSLSLSLSLPPLSCVCVSWASSSLYPVRAVQRLLVSSVCAVTVKDSSGGSGVKWLYLFTDRSSRVCGEHVWEHAAVPTSGLSHRRSASVWVQARSKEHSNWTLL